jgi:hypothetical protein
VVSRRHDFRRMVGCSGGSGSVGGCWIMFWYDAASKRERAISVVGVALLSQRLVERLARSRALACGVVSVVTGRSSWDLVLVRY